MENLYIWDGKGSIQRAPKEFVEEDKIIYEMIFHAFVAQEKQYGLNASFGAYLLANVNF